MTIRDLVNNDPYSRRSDDWNEGQEQNEEQPYVSDFSDGGISWEQAPARIKVIGVGGGGCNCVRRMLNQKTVPGVEFAVVNTDIKSFSRYFAVVGKHQLRLAATVRPSPPDRRRA